MTETPSFKNVSTTDMENALAKTISNLTGWPMVKISIDNIQFAGPQTTTREHATLQLRVYMESAPDDGMPF